MIDPFDALGSLLDHVWTRLVAGAADADDPFRHVVLATVGASGPQARTVALRRASRGVGEVEIHSDARTDKTKALGRDPRAEMLLWDPAAGLQVRLALEARLAVGDRERWDRVPGAARSNYGTDPAPGTPVTDPMVVRRTPDPSRFAAIVGQVRRIDAVSLAHDPHRRALFDGSGGRWIAP